MNKGDSVSREESLLRRVYRKDKRFRDPKTGIISSRAFAPRPKDQGRLSVNIERLIALEKAIMDPTKFILYRISNAIVRDLGLDCIYDPIIKEDFENLAHALIVGFDEEDESIPGI